MADLKIGKKGITKGLSNARKALAQRAADVSGKQLVQNVKPVGSLYSDDYWQQRRERQEQTVIQAYQQDRERMRQGKAEDVYGAINVTNPWKAGMDQWRGTYYNQQGYQPVPGPNGEELPLGAKQWDYYGRPYYGDGIKGWVNGFLARLTEPVGKAPDEIIATTPAPEGRGVSAIDLGKTIENIDQAAMSVGKEGEAPTALGYASRAVTGALGGLMQAAGEPAKKTEQVQSVKLGQEEMGKGSPLPSLLDMPDWLSTAIRINAPLFNSYQDLRALTGTQTLQDKYNIAERYYQSGRILYSTVGEPQLQSEFQRRYLAGESPYLLAMELENPVKEAVGQLVMDPLNLIGGGARHARDVRRIATAADEFLKIAPDIERFLTGVEAASDVEAVERLGGAVAAHMAYSKQVAAGLDKLRDSRGLFALTADGAKWQLGRTTGEITRAIAGLSANDPNEAVEMLRAMTLLASDNADDVTMGLTLAKNFKSPKMLLSQAGTQTGLVLRRMLQDENGVVDAGKFLDGLTAARAGGIDEMVKFADGKLTAAITGMFPTVTERIKAGEKVGAGLAAVSKADNWLQRGPVGFANKLFAGVYLGLSPGYAARNAIQNYASIAVDYGAGGLRYIFSPTRAKENVLGYLGGVLPKGMEGFGSAAAIAGNPKKLPFSRLAEYVETQAATLVVENQVRKVMKSMLVPGRALPDAGRLVEAGLSQDAANMLFKLVVESKGDVGKALGSFRKAQKMGSMDVLDTLAWLAKDDARALENFNAYDDVLEAVRAGRAAGENVDGVAARVRSVLDNLMAQADEVVDDPVAIADDLPEAATVVRSADDLPPETQKMAVNRYQATENANAAYEYAIQKTIQGALAQANAAGDVNAAGKIQQAQGLYTEAQALGKQAGAQSEAFRQNWNGRYERIKAANGRGDFVDYAAVWRDTGLASEPPRNWNEFRGRFWIEFYYPSTQGIEAAYRMKLAEAGESVAKLLDGGDNPMFAQARNAGNLADQYDELLVNYERTRLQVQDAIDAGDNKKAALLIANQFGIPTATEKGVPLDQAILRMVNKNADAKYADLAEVPPDVAREALARHTFKNKVNLQPPDAGNVATPARMLHEQRQGLEGAFANIEAQLRENWGRQVPLEADRAIDAALTEWGRTAEGRIAEARLIAANVGNAARDFTLLPYGKKRGLDLALAYVYPYQFWYSRTYLNWMSRIAQAPDVVAGYAKYKELLAKEHAGAPDWWKWNVNTNELLGMDSDNPLFFNLEATLNPLNGLTGVDFEDKYKRVNWWTRSIDDLGKFGPSVWTPINLAVATALSIQGEEDAAARWGGRLIPQTATLKSALALAHLKLPDTPFTAGNELDPMVNIFSGGLDPYERKRVGRALGMMIEEGQLSQAEAYDAAYSQKGDAWEEAIDRATLMRAPGQLMGFFAGVGFKARSPQDILIDQFYNEFFRLREAKPNYRPDEYTRMWDELREKYPFMDTVLLSGNNTDYRDESFAKGVMSRLPPGQKTSALKSVGITPEMLEKFYDTKTDLVEWPETDRARFMSGVVDIAALLEVPDGATRAEWTEASIAYGEMRDVMSQLYGPEIWDKIDAYFAVDRSMQTGRDQAQEMVNNDPELKAALGYQDRAKIADARLQGYYTSLSLIERYYKSAMYSEIEQKAGSDIYDKWDRYAELKLIDQKQASAYFKAHPELSKYLDIKDRWNTYIVEQIAKTAQELPEGKPAVFRPGAQAVTGAQEALTEELAPAQRRSWSEFEGMMSRPLERLVVDYIEGGENLPPAAQDQLERIASDMNVDLIMLLAEMEMAYGVK